MLLFWGKFGVNLFAVMFLFENHDRYNKIFIITYVYFKMFRIDIFKKWRSCNTLLKNLQLFLILLTVKSLKNCNKTLHIFFPSHALWQHLLFLHSVLKISFLVLQHTKSMLLTQVLRLCTGLWKIFPIVMWFSQLSFLQVSDQRMCSSITLF